jgi:hypothetical protein
MVSVNCSKHNRVKILKLISNMIVRPQSITKTDLEIISNLFLKRIKTISAKVAVVEALTMFIKSLRLVYRHIPLYKSKK